MPLSDDVQALADRTLSALDATHDYYTYTKRMWRLLQQVVKEGRRFSFRNMATGTRVDEQGLFGRVPGYIADHLLSSTFQDFVSRFEDFFFDLLRLWLAAYPGSLSRKQVEMGIVLRAPDKTAIIASMIDKEVNELKYERVGDWFEYLHRLAHIQASAAEMEKIAEIKASRDILVHNNGMANAMYVAKSGNLARFQDGERLRISETYQQESWSTIQNVIADLAAAAITKASPKPGPTN
jgi:hypothetical protein